MYVVLFTVEEAGGRGADVTRIMLNGRCNLQPTLAVHLDSCNIPLVLTLGLCIVHRTHLKNHKVRNLSGVEVSSAGYRSNLLSVLVPGETLLW